MDFWEASEGLEETSLPISRSAKPSKSNCSLNPGSSRFYNRPFFREIYSPQYCTKHTSLLSSFLTVRDVMTVLRMYNEFLLIEKDVIWL